MHNLEIENSGDFPHTTGETPVFLNDQEANYLAEMFSNHLFPEATNAAQTFCENIAIYNAMEYYNPGGHETLSGIVQYNSTNNNLMGFGLGGVDPYTIPETMDYYGYETVTYSIDEADTVTPSTEEVVIISSMNDSNNIFDGIHTYCLTAEQDESGNEYYVAHNAYSPESTSNEHYDSVEDFITFVNNNWPEEPIQVIEILGVEEQ